MSFGNTHTHYAVGYDNADVALVCLFVTFRHHPIFPQFLLIFSWRWWLWNGRHLSIGNAHMEPCRGSGRPVADGAVGPRGRSWWWWWQWYFQHHVENRVWGTSQFLYRHCSVGWRVAETFLSEICRLSFWTLLKQIRFAKGSSKEGKI